MRPPVHRLRRRAALLCTALVLGGCSLLGGPEEDGGDRAEPDGSTPTDAPPAATAWQDADVADVARGGTLRLGLDQQPATFNPVHLDAERSSLDRLLGPTSGGAVRLTSDGRWEVDEDYARSVEVVEDEPLQVRVRLEPDAVWEDGSAIDAADMQAFQQAMSDDDAYDVISTQGYDAITAVEKGRNRFEYTVTFEEPRSDWPLYVYPRLPADVSDSAKVFNRRFTERAVPSNGPFVVSEIDEETGTITQERNPRWWGAEPALERVVWRVAAPDLQAEAFAAGELDVADVEAGSLEALGPDAPVQRATGSQLTQLTLNAGRGALRDRGVRRAIALALDREAVAAGTSRGLGIDPLVPESLLVLPGQAGYEEVAGSVPDRDLDRARELLEEAGYQLDDDEAVQGGEQLTLTMPTPADAASVAARAEQVRTDLAEIGIAVEITEVAAEDFATDVLVPLDFDLVTFTWGPSLLGVQRAAPRFRPVDSPRNLTGVAAPGLEQAWREAETELDPDALTEAVAELDDLLVRQAVTVPLSVVPVVLAVREGVVNVGAASFEEPRWTTVGFLVEQ